MGCHALAAQVLARPGWAGSGVAVQAWWPHAVFYRIDPARFQDSTGDGAGDVAGITQRLEYLQVLGADAVVLDPAPPPGVDVGLDELCRQAVPHHLRVLVALAPARSGGAATLLAAARYYLNQGVAGLWLPPALLGSPQLTVETLRQLRALTASYPGQRILVSSAAPAGSELQQALGQSVQLLAAAPLDLAAGAQTASELQSELATATGAEVDARGAGAARRSGSSRARALPLLLPGPRLDAAHAAQAGDLALLLLGSRAAVLLEYGQELGLQPTASGAEPLMQWTPSNRTPPAAPPLEAPILPPQPQFQSYHAYVPRLTILPPPRPLPEAFVSDVPDPRTVPGFTKAEISPALAAQLASNGAHASAATEDGQPYSLLTGYRRLIEMHRQSPALNEGTQMFLQQADPTVLVWVRRPVGGARSAAAVLAVCNLSGHTLHLNVTAQLRALHLPDGGMHTLYASSPLPFEDTDDVVLPAYGAFLGGLVR